ncbi:MAG: glycosyltransferase [Treponema sp.]|nr:glycosyltransferase [Treponema sp.]
MNILVLSDRDLHETEAGGSRTIIMVNNYLAEQDGITVFSSYRHLSGANKKIIEIPITDKFNKEEINKIINGNNINILLIPEGDKYARLGRQAVNKTNCKVITGFHTKPGHETHCLWYDAFNTLFMSGITLKRRLRAFIKLIFFPVLGLFIKFKNLERFQRAYYDADRLVVLARSYIKEYKKQYFLKDDHKIAAIENALSFKNEITDEDFIKKEKRILVVSRLEERNKRLSIVLKLWKKIQNLYPDWNLDIVGSGIDEHYYKNFAFKHKLKNIVFYGRVDPQNYYTRASILLLTSVYEGWPMVLTESMQKGCVPVCMDNFSSVHDIINNNNDGFIVPDNTNKLMEKTVFLMNNPEIRKKMAYSGLISCKRFSMDNIGPKWIALFNQILS